MRVGILIACRMKSERLPQKALLPIVGKPMIDHLIERMKTSKHAQEIVLCTSTHPDDAILEQAALRNNIKFFKGSEEDVMGRFIGAAEMYQLDVVVRVTGDNPLTDAEHIDKLIESHLQTGADFSKIEQLPLGVNCEVISLSCLKKAHDLALDPNLSEYMTSYLKQPKYFKINVMEVDPYLNHPHIRLTVDVKADIELMEEIYRRLYHGGRIFSVKEIIHLLTQEAPHLLELNKNVPERSLPKILMKDSPVADKPKIVLFGARLDGHAGVVLDVIEQFALYNVVGFIDDDTSLHNTTVRGIPVLGGMDRFPELVPEGVDKFFISTSDKGFAEHCHRLVKQHNFSLVNIIHPSAQVSESVQLAEGIFIAARAVITHNAKIGNGVIINTGATIDHDNIIEDYVAISPGCHTSGRVHIKRGAFLGTGAVTIPDITIHEHAIVGAGTVVIRDVEAHSKVVGSPARKIN